MKKTFLAKRNALLSSTNVSWGALALVGAVFLLFLRVLAPNFFWYALTPVFRLSDALAQENHAFFKSFGDSTTLALQNEKLADENAALALQNQALLQKIESISGLTAEQEGIIVGVVARPPLSPYDTLVLSAGSDDGIALGQEVFGAGGVPLGFISSVLTRFSRATLFSSPGISTGGWVGQKNLPLIITGAGAGSFVASAARSADISTGDVVSVPGPGKLPMGVVAHIDSSSSSPTVSLRILPALNPFSTTWVVVRDTGTALRGALSSTTPFSP